MRHPGSKRPSWRLRFGTFLIQLCDSRRRVIVASLVFGAVGGLMEFVIHSLIRQVITSPMLTAVLDSVSVGVAVAVGVGALLFATRERRKRVLHEMARVAELNHHVRNALQIIAHSHYGAPSEHATMVLASVERIEKTLKELFPATNHFEI